MRDEIEIWTIYQDRYTRLRHEADQQRLLRAAHLNRTARSDVFALTHMWSALFTWFRERVTFQDQAVQIRNGTNVLLEAERPKSVEHCA